MKFIGLFLSVLGVLITGMLSILFMDSLPQTAGAFMGVSISLLVSLIIERRYGHRTIGSVFSINAVLKLGALPIVLFAGSLLLLVFSLYKQSFMLSFFGVTTSFASFMFVTLAIIARNTKREGL